MSGEEGQHVQDCCATQDTERKSGASISVPNELSPPPFRQWCLQRYQSLPSRGSFGNCWVCESSERHFKHNVSNHGEGCRTFQHKLKKGLLCLLPPEQLLHAKIVLVEAGPKNNLGKTYILQRAYAKQALITQKQNYYAGGSMETTVQTIRTAWTKRQACVERERHINRGLDFTSITTIHRPKK